MQRDIIMKEAEDQILRIQSKLNDNHHVVDRRDHQMVIENELEMFD